MRDKLFTNCLIARMTQVEVMVIDKAQNNKSQSGADPFRLLSAKITFLLGSEIHKLLG